MGDDFPFKIETLLEQCGGSREIGKVILDEFIIQAADDIKEIDTSIADGNWVQVGKVGHRLKGTAGVFGAAKLRNLCTALETAGKGGNSEEIAKTYTEVKAEIERCVAAIPEAKEQL